jgi:hypothetical protein
MLHYYSYATVCNNDDNLHPTEEPTEIKAYFRNYSVLYELPILHK